MKKGIFFFLFVLIFISFTSAEVQTIGPFKQNECGILTQTCDNCTFVNITKVLRTGDNSTIFTINQPMTKDGIFYNYSFCNTSQLAEYVYSTVGDLDGEWAVGNVNFEVTPTGKPTDDRQLYTRVFMILLLISTIFLIQKSARKINYDKWYSNIYKKYNTRNTFKWVLSAVGYNMIKNYYIFSYLLGLLCLLVITETTVFFGITSVILIMKIILGIYAFGSIPVTMLFFSQVQEWVMGWKDDLEKINWGELTRVK